VQHTPPQAQLQLRQPRPTLGDLRVPDTAQHAVGVQPAGVEMLDPSRLGSGPGCGRGGHTSIGPEATDSQAPGTGVVHRRNQNFPSPFGRHHKEQHGRGGPATGGEHRDQTRTVSSISSTLHTVTTPQPGKLRAHRGFESLVELAPQPPMGRRGLDKLDRRW
jgi:hypothetical protein